MAVRVVCLTELEGVVQPLLDSGPPASGIEDYVAILDVRPGVGETFVDEDRLRAVAP